MQWHGRCSPMIHLCPWWLSTGRHCDPNQFVSGFTTIILTMHIYVDASHSIGSQGIRFHGFLQVDRNVPVNLDYSHDVSVELSDECHVLFQAIWLSRIMVGVDPTDQLPEKTFVRIRSVERSTTHHDAIISKKTSTRTCYDPISLAPLRTSRNRSISAFRLPSRSNNADIRIPIPYETFVQGRN